MAGRDCAALVREISPACSRTFTCRETRRPHDQLRRRFGRPTPEGRGVRSRLSRTVPVLEASIKLARELALVGAARRFVDQTVTAWGLDAIRDEAVFITSELCANAVEHARSDFRVTLRSGGASHLRIEVHDRSDRIPAPAPPGQDATSGRGLATVGALATSWGARPEGAGKVVWAEIGRRGLSATGEGLDLSDSAL